MLPSEKRTVKEFTKAIESSFTNFTTECKFDRELGRTDLIGTVDRCALFADSEDVDVDDVEGTSILMPISFQIKKFFELPGVFQKICDNAANIRRNGKLNHFINGSLWKRKLQNYNEDQIVIPYHYYSDAAQLNHPLGPHCAKGQEDFQYFSFPTVPTEYQSRLENIFVAYLFPGTK